MSTQTVDGKGSSKPTTAEEQNELRRQAKARQKANKKGKGRSQDNGFRTGRDTDRRRRREAQVEEARTLIESSELSDPARQLVIDALDHFATHEKSSYGAAFTAVRTKLEDLPVAKRPRDGAVNYADCRFEQLMNRAYAIICQSDVGASSYTSG